MYPPVRVWLCVSVLAVVAVTGREQRYSKPKFVGSSPAVMRVVVCCQPGLAAVMWPSNELRVVV